MSLCMRRILADIGRSKSALLPYLAMSPLSQLRKRDASPALVLVIVCAGVVLASIDLFVVNVALPAIARDLHQRSLGDLSWVLNGYAIVYASLLVVFGRLAEGRSRDAGFLLGALIFTLSSAACGSGFQPDDAGRLPGRPGRGSGATDTDLAEPGARDDPSRAPPWSRPGVDGGRGRRRGARPGDRRATGRGGLALGVLRERPDRPGGTRDRVAPAPARPRSSGAGAGRARRCADHRRRRRAHARPGRGQ